MDLVNHLIQQSLMPSYLGDLFMGETVSVHIHAICYVAGKGGVVISCSRRVAEVVRSTG